MTSYENLPVAIEINNNNSYNNKNNDSNNNGNKTKKNIIHLNIDTPAIAIRINDEISPEVLAVEISGNNRCELYQYCLVIPFGLLSITLIIYYILH